MIEEGEVVVKKKVNYMDEFKNTHKPKLSNEEYKRFIESKSYFNKEYVRLKKYMNKKYPGGIKKPRVINEVFCDTDYTYGWQWEGFESLRQLELRGRQIEIKEGIELYHINNE